VFSIASSPAQRETVRITYAVHGRFTSRMESDLVEGREVWIKMPYGEFVVGADGDIGLFAGGTGITAFTAFLEGLTPMVDQSVMLAYGARTDALLIYRELVERCAQRLPALDVSYFVEHPGASGGAVFGGRGRALAGRLSVDAMWPRLSRPMATTYYISGPPPMVTTVSHDLAARNISAEAIHIDAWD
jgi:ferredoxin-NADP reductase